MVFIYRQANMVLNGYLEAVVYQCKNDKTLYQFTPIYNTGPFKLDLFHNFGNSQVFNTVLIENYSN